MYVCAFIYMYTYKVKKLLLLFYCSLFFSLFVCVCVYSFFFFCNSLSLSLCPLTIFFFLSRSFPISFTRKQFLGYCFLTKSASAVWPAYEQTTTRMFIFLLPVKWCWSFMVFLQIFFFFGSCCLSVAVLKIIPVCLYDAGFSFVFIGNFFSFVLILSS